MQGVVFKGGRELQLMQFDDPTPGPQDVVIEMKASGIAAATCINSGGPRAAGRRPGCR